MISLLLFFNIIKGYQKQRHPVSTHAKQTIEWPWEGDFDQEKQSFSLCFLVGAAGVTNVPG